MSVRFARFLDHLAAEIPCEPDDAATRGALRAMRSDRLLALYLNHFGRFVPARPRAVSYAGAFWTAGALRHGADVAALGGKIRRGEDLTPHLSPNLRRYGFAVGDRRRWEPVRDLALNAFDMHHLHLTPGGGDALAFVEFRRAEARFVHLGDHRSFDNGSLGEAVAHHRVEIGMTINGLSVDGAAPSARRQMQLARRSTSSFGAARGRVTRGSEIMCNGDALRTRMLADCMLDMVEQVDPTLDDREEVDRRLPEARPYFGEEVDLDWIMNDTDLVLFDKFSRTLCTVITGFC